MRIVGDVTRSVSFFRAMAFCTIGTLLFFGTQVAYPSNSATTLLQP